MVQVKALVPRLGATGAALACAILTVGLHGALGLLHDGILRVELLLRDGSRADEWFVPFVVERG